MFARFILCAFFLLPLSGVLGQGLPEISAYSPSLGNVDHNSDGFVVTMPNGNLVHLFRLDPGPMGYHFGNTGRIAMRKSYDNGLTWDTTRIVFNDNYDNRNIHGGLIHDSVIYLTARRFDAFANLHIDYSQMLSYDEGQTWTTPEVINSQGQCSGTHMLIEIPGRGYYNIIYTSNYVELRQSDNGIEWDSIVHVWDYRISRDFVISEACFAWIGEGKLIGLLRNDSIQVGQAMLQVMSDDYGLTWTTPQMTNLADSFFVPSPCIFYDQAHDDLWVIATDRRAVVDSSLSHLNEELWVYKSDPDSVFINPSAHELYYKSQRPYANIMRFYGYPVASKLNNGNYIVLFVESTYRDFFVGERAFFYKFYIDYDPQGNASVNLENQIQCWPNPFSEDLWIQHSGGISSVEISDMTGKTVYRSGLLPDLPTEIQIPVNDIAGPGIYLGHVHSKSGTSVVKLIKQ
jgi:hypothetical protein